MKAIELKEVVEQIVDDCKKACTNITDDMLENNGAIWYMNGRDGTEFCFDVNDCLCPFFVFHNNKGNTGFIKIRIEKSGKIFAWIYEDGENKPTDILTYTVDQTEVKEFYKAIWYISDNKGLFDKDINDLDWDIDTNDIKDYPEGNYLELRKELEEQYNKTNNQE